MTARRGRRGRAIAQQPQRLRLLLHGRRLHVRLDTLRELRHAHTLGATPTGTARVPRRLLREPAPAAMAGSPGPEELEELRRAAAFTTSSRGGGLRDAAAATTAQPVAVKAPP